jgi:hypothetical protein
MDLFWKMKSTEEDPIEKYKKFTKNPVLIPTSWTNESSGQGMYGDQMEF